MNYEILGKTYVIENTAVGLAADGQGPGKKTGEKLRQNFGKLLKKHVENMSVNRPLAMLMKSNELR